MFSLLLYLGQYNQATEEAPPLPCGAAPKAMSSWEERA